MATVLYLHGFLSSPQSSKAKVTWRWLAKNHPDVDFCCPQLSSYPSQAIAQIEAELDSLTQPVYVIGSSLGGFWATNLVERGLVAKAVLVNPAVDPHTRFDEFKNVPLQSYYSDETYCLTEKDLQDLVALNYVEPQQPNKYMLMVQTGDETLDYRMATKKYRHCKQIVEEGGSHTFDGYENWLPQIIEFFTQQSSDQ
ncbi:YqiA/YcfP family alpha/beta fold hydrolase [Saccharophagus degradans]|uniref:Esterase n=1 Tax=Saccharophagus degradans (strain 2-40 / ATCC 43961 / DSM 17024) TaxID=203122 RepID=Q21NU2_SACD2|nr:YqiA/YcfP family alpha/beta fold hydrolase [Saccharophagus degradans]ABD79637.1 protein of unknown function UPF0227 [Saccharophagus degradans 2-40]